MIAVIRSTGSNFASVGFALERLGVDAVVTDDPEVVVGASRVILPGVGSAQTGMAKLRAAGLSSVIPSLTQPVLGICLGMQLMFDSSEEGSTDGLGIFRGVVRRLMPRAQYPVPHMGWNTVDAASPSASDAPADEHPWAYFVHSYAAPIGPDTIATTRYTEPFASIVRRDNFMGVQFHPERSAEFGSAVLKSFIEQT